MKIQSIIIFLSLIAISLHAEHQHTLKCRHWNSFHWPVDTSVQRYGPQRQVDILDLSLDVTPNFKERRVAGTATIHFKTMQWKVQELRLDAYNLEISSVEGGPKIEYWENTDRELVITFEQPIPPKKDAKISIVYEAEPIKGLYFRTPELGYQKSDMHIWTQGETIEARHWFPCFDAPNEFLTSSITCRVPRDMTVLSNGRRIAESYDPKTGLKAVTWAQEKPHVNYLISLVAGYFKSITQKHGDISMSFWTPPSEFGEAANSFRETKQCMEFMEKEIGVPYPWAKYDQVCVQDFNWGGMENTSLSTLNASTLFSLETENLRSSQGLVAHELAHQWFGDLVTCKDWSHIWLNEGFATYYTHLFAGHKDGRDQMLFGLYRDLKRITSRSNETVPMVNRKYERPSDMFSKYGYMSYTKGSWVLHMIRSKVGQEIFRNAVKAYLQKHRHGNVVTENLVSALETASEINFDRFFDQYVYHAHHPELKIGYSWDQKRKLAKLNIKQEQNVDDNIMLFSISLPIRFNLGNEVVEHSVPVTRKAEDFYFKLRSAPKVVRVDPDLTILAKTSFSPSVEMLHNQLKDTEDTIGRILAVEELGKRKDKTSVAKLKDALNNDKFYGVRVAASKALRNVDTELALGALIDSAKQTDARVRRQVISDIGSFYGPSSLETLKTSLKNEANPGVQATAIRSLAGFGDKEASTLIRDALKANSYRHQVADAAITAMRTQDDPSEIKYLLTALRRDRSKFTSRGYGSGLKVLGYLTRNENDKSNVRNFLLEQLGHPNSRINLAAIESLGELGDPSAISSLEKVASGREDSASKIKAEKAIEKLRSGRKPVDDFKNLRKELSDLKKSNESLEKKIDDLRKSLNPIKREDTDRVSAED